MAVANPAEMPNCPECGEELGSGDPAGLCPKCLILGAFDSSVGAEESGTQTIDTAKPATTISAVITSFDLSAKAVWEPCTWPNSANPFAAM
jgi:hypothetical protein